MASNVKAIFIFFASFIVCSYSFASYEDYKAAYDKKDYKKALEFLLPLVDKGDDKANYSMCFLYVKGHGVETDYTKAYDFCMKSAMKGNAKAQYMLGVLRSDSDYTKESRELIGLPNYGALSEDLVQSEIWFKESAANGFNKATNGLCRLYSTKARRNHSLFGGYKYYDDAIEWCKKSALLEEDNQKIRYELRVASLYADSGDYKSAMEWYKKNPDYFKYEIGVLYRDGLGVTKDYVVAFEWFKKSADNGEVFGLDETAIAYLEGRGTKKDKIAGIDYLRKAAVYGGHSLYRLGLCHMNADGVQYDPVLAYVFISEGFAPVTDSKEKEKYMGMLEKKLTKEQRVEVEEIKVYLKNGKYLPLPTSSKTGAGMRR